MSIRSRRQLLVEVGQGMLLAGLGGAAWELGVSAAIADGPAERLRFGRLDPLVDLLQATPPERVLQASVERLRQGASLEDLAAAAALANARAFGGHDYTGYHTFMALLPAWQMARELPTEERALPVLKVIYRNSQRIHGQGADDHDALEQLPQTVAAVHAEPEAVRAAVRAADRDSAESRLADLCSADPQAAFDAVQLAVRDEVNVHRVVLAWRAWAMLELAGMENAHTLLRQAVRFCIDSEENRRSRQRAHSPVQELLPRLIEEQRLREQPRGTRPAEDAWVQRLAATIYGGTPAEAATEVAAALGEGFDPDVVGEAISLAANLLVLHDPGRSEQNSTPEKPAGCVHGDSTGVHASDAANAWRNISRVSSPLHAAASLIVGAYHTAGQSRRSLAAPLWYADRLESVTARDQDRLLTEVRAAVAAGDQGQACAVAHRYSELGHAERPLFDLLLQSAVSEDGALHAEKYYRTVVEEFATTRPALRGGQLVALARVSASQQGHPAPGVAEARELLSRS